MPSGARCRPSSPPRLAFHAFLGCALGVQGQQPREHLFADLVRPAVAPGLLLPAPGFLVDFVVEQELAARGDVVPAGPLPAALPFRSLAGFVPYEGCPSSGSRALIRIRRPSRPRARRALPARSSRHQSFSVALRRPRPIAPYRDNLAEHVCKVKPALQLNVQALVGGLPQVAGDCVRRLPRLVPSCCRQEFGGAGDSSCQPSASKAGWSTHGPPGRCMPTALRAPRRTAPPSTPGLACQFDDGVRIRSPHGLDRRRHLPMRQRPDVPHEVGQHTARDSLQGPRLQFQPGVGAGHVGQGAGEHDRINAAGGAGSGRGPQGSPL